MTSLKITFLDRAAILRIAAITFAVALGGVVYAICQPNWFRSAVTVVPAVPQRGGMSSFLGAGGSGLVASLDTAVGGSADTNRIAAVLQSVAVSDAVIAKFDLRARYGQKYDEGARAVLWQHCEIKSLPRPNLVRLSCEDRDPRFVQRMLQFFAEYGNQVFRRISVGSAAEEARFLEKRVVELRQQADAAAAKMRAFQEEHHIVDIESQTKAVVAALAALNSQRISKQLELEYARTFSSGDESAMRQMESQLAVVDSKLRTLEQIAPESVPRHKPTGKEAGGGLFPVALTVPKLRAEFENLFRDTKVTEATLVYALERLEGARANEARDTSTFLILDPAALPTLKSRPQRLSIVLTFALVGFVLSLGFEWWKHGGAALLAAFISGNPGHPRPHVAQEPSDASRRERSVDGL